MAPLPSKCNTEVSESLNALSEYKAKSFGSRYSRMDQVKFVEDNL